MAPRTPTPYSPKLCRLMQQRALADVIETEDLDVGDCPRSSRWPDRMARVLQSRRRRQGSVSEGQTCGGLELAAAGFEDRGKGPQTVAAGGRERPASKREPGSSISGG